MTSCTKKKQHNTILHNKKDNQPSTHTPDNKQSQLQGMVLAVVIHEILQLEAHCFRDGVCGVESDAGEVKRLV